MQTIDCHQKEKGFSKHSKEEDISGFVKADLQVVRPDGSYEGFHNGLCERSHVETSL